MASPHVAGAAALLRELHSDWSVEDIKALLMNTAVSVQNDRHVSYPGSRGGSGRIALGATLDVDTIAEPIPLRAAFPTFLRRLWGFRAPEPDPERQVVNHGNRESVFQVAVNNTFAPFRCDRGPQCPEISVPAGGSILVPVRWNSPPPIFGRSRDETTPCSWGQAKAAS